MTDPISQDCQAETTTRGVPVQGLFLGGFGRNFGAEMRLARTAERTIATRTSRSVQRERNPVGKRRVSMELRPRARSHCIAERARSGRLAQLEDRQLGEATDVADEKLEPAVRRWWLCTVRVPPASVREPLWPAIFAGGPSHASAQHAAPA
jgi:hypothetical protein